MKLPAGINKSGSVVLGALCLLLVANLVAQYRDMQPGHSQARRVLAGGTPTRSEKTASPVPNDLAKYDPAVHLDALKKLLSRPLPDEDRNPFEFVGGAAPAPPPPQTMGRPIAPAAAPPPPPPPPPLKAVGYNDLPGGKREAMVTFNEDLQVVHEGDVIGTKYKVIKIDPTKVVVEDGETHHTLELPFQP